MCLADQAEKAINANGVEQSLPGTGIQANSTIEVKFSKDVDASTVTTGTVFLTQNGVKQLATVSYNSTKKIATVELSAGNTLTPGKDYTLTVNGVKADGKEIEKSTTNFSVSNNPIITDATFPHASGVTDLDGAVIDTNNEVLTFDFNKEMDQNTINTSNVKLYDVTDEKYVAITISRTNATKYTVTPTSPNVFESTHEYRLDFNSSVADLGGNKLNAMSYKFFYDIPAVQVTTNTVSPANSATDVYNKITAAGGNDAFKFRAQFSAPVDASTVNGSTVKLVDKVTGSTVDADVTYESGSRYVVVTPRADLKENAQYEVTIDGVKTSKGIKVTKKVSTFTTGDFTAPTVVSSTPANAADGVAVDGTFTVNFSEKMAPGNLVLGTNVILEDVTSNNTQVAGFANWTSTLSQDGKTLTIKPSSGAKLDPNKTYRLTVKKSATDVASPANPLADDYKVLFNTSAAASTKLENIQSGASYSTSNPVLENGVTSVGAATGLLFNFDTALKADAGSYKLHELVKVEKLNPANGTYTTVPTVATAPSAGQVEVSLTNNGKSIKVVAPNTDNWTVDSTYRVTIPTSVKDVNLNDVQKVDFSFTTGPKPVVDTAKSSPSNFATGVAVNEEYLAVVINDVNSDLQSSSLNSDNVKLVKKSDGTVAPYSIDSTSYAKKAITSGVTASAVGGNKTITTSAASNLVAGDIITVANTAGTYVVTSVSGTTVTVDKNIATTTNQAITIHQGVVFKLNNGAKLAGNTDYQVQVKDVADAAGNKVSNTTIAFKTTADVAALELDSTSIQDGATGIKVDAPIELTFNEAVTNATLSGITLAGGSISSGDYTVSRKAGNNKVVVIAPKGFLKASNTVYTVTVASSVASDGGAIGTAETVQFQTEATASATPKVTAADYYDTDNNGVDAGDIIKVTFNAPVGGDTSDLNLGDDFATTVGAIDATSTVAVAADGLSAVITLAGSGNTFVPGVSTVGVSTTGATTPYTWVDGMGNTFSTDKVAITKK